MTEYIRTDIKVGSDQLKETVSTETYWVLKTVGLLFESNFTGHLSFRGTF